MNDELKQSIRALAPDMEATRHALHARPELSEHEVQTSAFVAERLQALGLPVRTGVGGHGVIAEIAGGRPGKTIAIRADMDALPIQEANDVPYRSQNAGVMHACGHDGHTTILLGTARTLAARRAEIAGTVRLLFQPAEETVGGAKRMCDEGAMEGVDAVVALHGWPGVEVGAVGVKNGAMMASADTFDIIVHGKGGHAAYPHATVDPIVIGAEITLALQTIASREIDPTEPVVVSVTKFQAGTAYNVIQGAAQLAGTYRTLSNEVRNSLPERIQRVAEGVCAAHRATCEVRFAEGTPSVLNDAGVVDLLRSVAADSIGADKIVEVERSSMGAEDFAVYLQHAPGAMFRLGLGDISMIHTPTFDFTDAALPIGVELFSRIALEYLR